MTYGLLGYVWFHRFRAARFGEVGRRAGAGRRVGADLLENLLIGLGAPLGWLLLVATAVKWAALLPAVALALWTLRPTLARLPKALYTHRYSAAIVLPLAVLSLGRGPDLLEQLPDIQRAWADPGHHGDFVWAGLVMCVLVVATLFIGRQRTGHLWMRVCPEWTGDEHPCRQDECPVQQRREHEHAPRPLLRLWFIGPVLLVLAAAGLGLAGRRHRDRPARRVLRAAARRRRLSLFLRHHWGSAGEGTDPCASPSAYDGSAPPRSSATSSSGCSRWSRGSA